MSTISASDRRGEEAAFDTFLAALGAQDRLKIKRHLTDCEAKTTPEHARLWKRLACHLADLAPHSIRATGMRAVQFFVADGPHRRQAFALEDPRDGTLLLYTDDCLEEATRRGILGAALREGGKPPHYAVAGAATPGLSVDLLTAGETTAAPDYYRHMLGWNRRALRVTLAAGATADHVRAAESLCALTTEPRQAAATPVH